MSRELPLEHVGYFIKGTPSPIYDPPWDAPCPMCGAQITEADVRTHSACRDPSGTISVFFRTHRTCGDLASKDTVLAYCVQAVNHGDILERAHRLGPQ